MIVKTLTWKTRGFDRLIDYIGKEARDEDETFRLLHNLRPSRNLGGIAGQFWAQDAFRKTRANGVILYHEILSFAPGQDVPLDVAEDLTREYLNLRAPNALAYAEPHFDKGHLHVHVIISGTEFESAKTLRLSINQFMRVRRQIEKYQQEHYPELDQSLVYLNERKRRRRREDVEQTRIAELEEIQKSKTGRHLEQEPTLPEEAHLDDIPDPGVEAATLEAEATEQAEAEVAQAETEALQQEAEMEAQRAAEEEQRAEAERQAEEARRIQELEAIQAEAYRREQARGLEMD